jgi:hypothetical protein
MRPLHPAALAAPASARPTPAPPRPTPHAPRLPRPRRPPGPPRCSQISTDLAQLPSLEMCRVAVSDVASLPRDMLMAGAFPALAWASLGGCPAAVMPPQPPADLPSVR